MAEHQQAWQIFVENREAVVAALERGECAGILPAVRGFLDGFAGFLLEGGVLELLEEFPDHRQRRTIPMFFFCHTLVYRPLFRLERIAPIERTLFRSPYILRQLGFNALQMEEGFYQTPEGQRPFRAQAIADCFSKSRAFSWSPWARRRYPSQYSRWGSLASSSASILARQTRNSRRARL